MKFNLKEIEIRSKKNDANSYIENNEPFQSFNNLNSTFHSIVEKAHESIIIIRDNFLISYVNRKFCSLFNVNNENILGNDFRIYLDKDVSDLFTENIKALKNGKDIPLNYSINFIGKDGKKIFLEVNTMIIKNEDEGLLIVAQLLDITEKKIFESQLISAKEEAEIADKLKSEFLAQISHEIRTPINTLLSFASLMRGELENVISDDLRTGFDIMDRAGKRIIRTTDLILNMSEIQLGTYEPHMMEFDLCEDILNSLTTEFSSLAADKGIDFKVNKKLENCIIVADKYTVSQIMRNILDNAIKFTFDGGIIVNVYNGKPDEVSFDVQDTGVGISEEYLPNMFKTFSQEEQGYTRKYDGNGLGLALVKRYCELNNAQITVESKKQIGSKFVVVFAKKRLGIAE